MTEKTTSALLRPDYSDPTRYKEASNGAVRDLRTGRIVTIDPSRNPHAITKETTQEMHARRHVKDRTDYLKGIIIGRGEEPIEGASLEELEEQAGESKVQMWAHWLRTFLKSSNLRGMSDSGKQLLYGPGQVEGEEPEQDDPRTSRVLLLIAELTRRDDFREVIDATESDE